jgi:hypothetical protein
LLATTVYVLPNGTVGNQNFDGTLGMDFTVNLPGYSVDKLGAFTNGQNTIFVTLFDLTAGGCGNSPCATGAAIASTSITVPSQNYDYAFNTLGQPVSLIVGHTYQIAAYNYGALNQDYNTNVSNNGALDTNSLLPAGLLTFDTSAYYNFAQNQVAQNTDTVFGYGAGNLNIVADAGTTPIPGAWLLILTGLAMFGLISVPKKHA